MNGTLLCKIGALALLGSAVLLGNPIGAAMAESGGKLVFAGAGGASLDTMNAAFIQPWAKEYKVDVVLNPSFDLAKVKAMVDAGSVSWDLFVTDGASAQVYCGTYMEKLDFAKIDVSHLNEDARKSVSPCYIPFHQTAIVLAWNKRMGGNAPKSWADFFNPAIKGKRAVFSALPNFSGVYEIAMKASGKPVYPIDYDVALKEYDKIRDQIVFYKNAAQLQQYLEAGTVDMAIAFAARMDAASKSNSDFGYDFTWNDSFVRMDGLAIPKGAPDAAEAMSLMSYILQPGPQAARAALFPAGPVTKDTKVVTSPQSEKYLPTPETLAGKAIYQSDEWWSKNLDEAIKKWTGWTLR